MRLPGFDYRPVDVDGVAINCAVAGSGPPLLLLHGYPESHLMWRAVAGDLAANRTVVATDLRGYGDSDKPTPDAEGVAYSKRAMAADQLGVMRHLGFDRFDVVSHDRGARVAHRLALDNPESVQRLAVLDIVPTRHVLLNTDRNLASGYFHWFFTSTTGGIPERLIGLDPEFWLRAMVDRLAGPGAELDPATLADYVRWFSDPAAVAATCADYRSAATIDLEHDEASMRQGARIACPTLVLWGEQAFVGRTYEPLRVWQQYATDVTGRGLPCGHFLPEEAPDAVVSAVRDFLDR
jgi:haloacetate dehalogenase